MRFLAVCFGLIVLLPQTACAWGFGVHLQLGHEILAALPSLPPHLQRLLSAFPADFLYGCISADITIGKKFTHYLKHCHSWSMGQQLLAAAGSDAQRACAYGYLAHLAADTVAHGYMVPFKMVRSYNTVLLNHAYWELRFESQVPASIWQQARLLVRHNFAENDRLLRQVMARTLFSFRTNKRLFNSMLLVSRIQHWQLLLHTVDRTSRWVLEKSDRQEYLELASQASFSVLCDADSPYLRADPTGERALYVAQQLRKNLNLLWLDGKLDDDASQELSAALKKQFRQAITEPDRLLELLANSS